MYSKRGSAGSSSASAGNMYLFFNPSETGYFLLSATATCNNNTTDNGMIFASICNSGGTVKYADTTHRMGDSNTLNIAACACIGLSLAKGEKIRCWYGCTKKSSVTYMLYVLAFKGATGSITTS